MATSFGLLGYFLFVIFLSILAVSWVLLPIMVLGIRKRLDRIIELLSQQVQE